MERDHVWHMETLKALCVHGKGLLLATLYKVADLLDPDSIAAGAS